MISYKRYKEIFYNTSFWGWVKYNIPLYIKRLHRIPYCTYMCIRYPFLYPRNRFTDKHRINLLSSQLYHLHEDALLEVSITGKLEKENNSYSTFAENSKITVDLLSNHKKLIISNGIETKTHDITDLLWRDDTFKILGIKLWEERPHITVYVKPKDENDKTNYGFHYERVKLLKNKFKLRLYKIVKWIDEEILDRIFCLPNYIEWDAMPTGWNKAFGKQYLKDLKKQLKKDKMLYKWRIMDIKEKFGTLRVSYNYGSNELYQLINKYENLSWNTCINCGKPATHTSKGWISPYCEDCVNKSKNPEGYIKRNTKEEEEYYNSMP